MRTDAHVHLDALLGRDPGFPERFLRDPWPLVSSVHDTEGEAALSALAARGVPFRVSAGIHPQYVARDAYETFGRLTGGDSPLSDRVVAVGECGFDFFGKYEGCVRTPENEAAQRRAFEFQLDAAERLGVPLVVHCLRGFDVLLGYAKRLSKLEAVVFHSWGGHPTQAQDLLARGVNGYFSFGASILNGNKKAFKSCYALPEDRILLETDAPWQAPTDSGFCRLEHIDDIAASVAGARFSPKEAVFATARANFGKVYGF